MEEQRQLAAIMFTDIVGYSALMTKDEKVALQILAKNRELQKSTLKRFKGDFIKEIGDGTLSIFKSSWDAVSCAMELQSTLQDAANFQLRIGIHQGDIVVSAKDVFGDGVNIAARIQALCEPGGILISETVYNDIRNKTGIKAECLGGKSLKNIDEPVKVYSISAECFKRISEQQSSKEIKYQQGKSWLRTRKGILSGKRAMSIAGVIILASMVIAGGYFILSKKQPVSTKGTEKSIIKDNREIWTNSIAILAFTDLSPEKDQEYFCDGMSEELINVMTQISDLKVVARTSAFSFKGKEVDIRDIGKKLNVKTILEGSVRKSGNQLRISAQLIDVRNGYHLWSQTFDRELKDVFVIQEEISSAIVAALKTKLLPEDMSLAAKKQTKNTEAYELYLNGRFYWNKRTANDLLKAIDYFNQAIGNDPDYGMAYAGLASSYVVLPEYAALSSKDNYLKTETAARKALELDPTLTEPHAIFGIIKSNFEYDQQDAEREYKSAIKLNPGSPTAHHWYSIYLRKMARLDESLAEIKLAQELDPLSLIINHNVGWTLFLMQQYDRAMDQCQKVLELDPDFHLSYYCLGLIYEAQGKFSESLSMYRQATRILGNSPYYLSHLGRLYVKTGRKDDALKILDELLTYSGQGYQVSCNIASLYLSLGDKEKAFEWLEKSYEDRDVSLRDLKTMFIWDSIRSDPEFIALLRKMGLEK